MATRKSKSQLEDTLNKKQLCPHIRNQAHKILCRLNQKVLAKAKSSHTIIFYLIYQSHIETKSSHNVQDIATIAQVPPKNIKQIMKQMALLRKKYSDVCGNASSICVVTADQLIPIYCEKIAEVHMDHVSKIQNKLKDLVTYEPLLKRSFPQKLAAASILLYLESYSIIVDDDKFLKAVNVDNPSSVLTRLRQAQASLLDHKRKAG